MLARHRLGHRDLAMHWLERLRKHPPSTDPAQFRDEWEFSLLRSEAESMILYDPVFPADPFAALSKLSAVMRSRRVRGSRMGSTGLHPVLAERLNIQRRQTAIRINAAIGKELRFRQQHVSG